MMVFHRHVIGILPSGLDKRAHLGEQQGATANPQHRGRLTGVVTLPSLFGAKIGRVVSSQPTPRPPHGEIRLSHLCNKRYRHGCIDEKIMAGITASGAHPYRETFYIEGPIVSISP